jgi:hypothetical protein
LVVEVIVDEVFQISPFVLIVDLQEVGSKHIFHSKHIVTAIVGSLELDRTVHAWLGIRNVGIILGSDEGNVSLAVEYFDHDVLVIGKQLEDSLSVEEMVAGRSNMS